MARMPLSRTQSQSAKKGIGTIFDNAEVSICPY